MVVKQRVNSVIVKTLYRLFQLLGYKSVYIALFPVVGYYFFFAGNVKEALREYYARLGLRWSEKRYFRHLFCYAVTMTDRFISKTDPQLYTMQNNNREAILRQLREGTLLLSTHYGGWAAASNYFREDGMKIKVVMSESMMAQVRDFERILDKKNSNQVEVIDISKGQLDTSIAIANALLEKESVAMMGDRVYSDKHLYPAEFLGKRAYFNKNPFQIAYKAKRNIVVLFVLYKGINRYEMRSRVIEMERFNDEKEAIEGGIGEYVRFLTEIVKAHPEQWFNFYNFWSRYEVDNR